MNSTYFFKSQLQKGTFRILSATFSGALGDRVDVFDFLGELASSISLGDLILD